MAEETATTKAQDEFLTVEEAAKLLKVKPSTVKTWARAGKIPGAAKLGKVWRFNRRIMSDELGKAHIRDGGQGKDGG
jgi:excisionase family DNA binding protein